MRPILPILLCATLAATGCSRIADSRLNPFNWFGGSQSEANVDQSGELRPLIPDDASVLTFDNRVLIGAVSSLTIDRTPDGAIVRATGIATSQGQFNAELVPVNQENGTLTLAFRVQTPTGNVAQGSNASRQISAAYVLDLNELAAIRAVRVQGQQNSLVSRR